MKKVKAVIFDWDDTLCMIGYPSYRKALKKAGVKFNKKKFAENWGLPWKVFVNNVCSGINSNDFKQWFDEAENQVQKDKILISGMEGVLKRLESDGLYVGILTNSSWARMKRHMKMADFSWQASGIRSMVMCTDDYRKPDVEAFLSTETSLNAVGIIKNECVYVGDSLIDGQFARNLGIDLIIPLDFSHFNKNDFSGLNYDKIHFIKNLKFLPRFIEGMNSSLA